MPYLQGILLRRQPEGPVKPRDIIGRMKHFKLICPETDDIVFDAAPENAGFRRAYIVRLIEQRAPDGGFEIVNGSALSPAQREAIYFTEAMPAAGNRYQIRRVFGTNSQGGGPFLGTHVPALLVSEEGRPVDVYPYMKKDGSYRTIRDFLEPA